ncbi:MAG: M48 family metallopeptidase [Pirellula sp.]
MLNQPSFTGRILLALILMICFYTFALSLAGFLIFLPIGMAVFLHRIHLQLSILSFIGGCMILWSVIPRRDKFVAPGPKLNEKEQPELFKQLRSLSQSTGQSMPVEVYALPEMNAWVANRGGIMGLGSRRIMGIGIPLMQILSTQQLRGVLAHEFGHYYGGDTKLGPWLFITRSAIIRTVMNLASNGSSILSIPFEWYLNLFLRITQKVSRQQEFTADALAATIVGPEAIAEALKAVHSKALAFDAYWQNEYSPALELGVRPPMAKGFRDYSDAPKIKEAVDSALKHAMEESKSDIYDSHPALKERIAAIQKVTGPRQASFDPPAIDWIRDVDGLERQMIDHMAKSLGVKSPEPISWNESVQRVLVPNYLKLIEEFGGNIEALNLGQATEKLRTPKECIELLNPKVLPHITDDEAKRVFASRVIGTLAILAFEKRGWTIQNPIGDIPYIQKLREENDVDGQEDEDQRNPMIQLNPFDWIEQFINRKWTLDELIGKYQDHRIDTVRLIDIVSKR